MKTNEHFSNRTEIAKYLNMSRMELWRFEQVHALKGYKYSHVSWVTQKEVDDWYEKAFKARYGRALKC